MEVPKLCMRMRASAGAFQSRYRSGSTRHWFQYVHHRCCSGACTGFPLCFRGVRVSQVYVTQVVLGKRGIDRGDLDASCVDVYHGLLRLENSGTAHTREEGQNTTDKSGRVHLSFFFFFFPESTARAGAASCVCVFVCSSETLSVSLSLSLFPSVSLRLFDSLTKKKQKTVTSQSVSQSVR